MLHSALHPHVIKIAETFTSSDAMLDHFHRHYDGYLSGVFNFRAAVNPTVQAYTPLEASLRPCLSATYVSVFFSECVVIFLAGCVCSTGRVQERGVSVLSGWKVVRGHQRYHRSRRG